MMFSYQVLLTLVSLLVHTYHAVSGNAGPSHGKVIVCYVGTWSVYRPERGSFKIEDLDPTLCTHIIYSFAGLDIQENAIKSLDPWQDLTEDYGKGGFKRLVMLKNQYPHLKITLAIGGWNEGSANYSLLVSDANRRRQFVQSALNFIKKYNFDGLDLDWEFPAKRGGKPEDKDNFLLLVKELKAAFQKHNLLVTAAFGAGKDTIDAAYDVRGLAAYLDFIHMMCYDYHGSWDSKLGANAPLRAPPNDVLSVEYTINYMLKLGAIPEKLVLGLPLYGRTFNMIQPMADESIKKFKLNLPAKSVGFAGPFTRENGFMGYNEICLELSNETAAWKILWDKESSTPYALRKDQAISYDNEESLREKIRFAMKKKLAGVMVWSIDTDDFHGDCDNSNDVNGSPYRNYPLMRSIGKSLEVALSEIAEEERQKENEIDHDGGHDGKGGAGYVNYIPYLYYLSYLLCLFRAFETN